MRKLFLLFLDFFGSTNFLDRVLEFSDRPGMPSVGRKNQNENVLLHCLQKKPLRLWDKRIRGGYIYQVADQDLHSCVLEIVSSKSSRTYITCPADPKKILGIQAPYLHLTVKNLHRSFVIDVLIRDDKNVERRFKALTKQASTQITPYICKMPLTLEKGWNLIVVPLKEYTQKMYGTKYVETLRVQMHATCRVEKIFFSYKPHFEDEVFLKLPTNVKTAQTKLWNKNS